MKTLQMYDFIRRAGLNQPPLIVIVIPDAMQHAVLLR